MAYSKKEYLKKLKVPKGKKESKGTKLKKVGGKLVVKKG